MVFNIEEGGEGVDFARVIEAIRLADPDIVALQEAMTNTDRIAAALGWDFASARSQVISRYPIVEPGDADGVYVLVEVQPGRCVAIASVHPPAEPYGPELAWRGGSAEDVVALERRIRLPKLAGPLRALPALATAGIPGVLAGRLQRPVPPRLDRGHGGSPAARPHRRGLARESGGRSCRVPRRMARDPSGSASPSRA